MIDNNSKEFIYRHIGPSEEEQQKMLKSVGYKTLENLIAFQDGLAPLQADKVCKMCTILDSLEYSSKLR